MAGKLDQNGLILIVEVIVRPASGIRWKRMVNVMKIGCSQMEA
jgi:hypothetical protein